MTSKAQPLTPGRCTLCGAENLPSADRAAGQPNAWTDHTRTLCWKCDNEKRAQIGKRTRKLSAELPKPRRKSTHRA